MNGFIISIYLILLSFCDFSSSQTPIAVMKIEDPSEFEMLIYDGAEQFARESNGQYEIYYQNFTFDKLMEAYASAVEKSHYIVGYGFEMIEPVEHYSKIYKDHRFIIVDFALEGSNILGLIFAEDEAGFLAGVLAGLLTKSKITGCIGGVAIGPVKLFCNGFHEGVLTNCPDCVMLLDYAPDWENVEWGREVGERFSNQGADIIFGAGGEPGTQGIIKASENENVYVIGVDKDEYLTSFWNLTQASRLLTSAIKRVDVGTNYALRDITSDDFVGGIKLIDSSADGVGLADCHESCYLWTESVNRTYEEVQQQLITGKQTTNLSPNGDKVGVSTLKTNAFFPLHPSGFFPLQRTRVSLVRVRDVSTNSVYLYMYGSDYSFKYDDFYKYQWSQIDELLPKPNNWSTVFINKTISTSIPLKRQSHSMVNYNDKTLILFGGRVQSNMSLNVGTITDELWTFDLATSTWTQQMIQGESSDSKPQGRHSHVSAIIGDYMYVYGGVSSTLSVLDDIWSLHIPTMNWKRLNPLGDKLPKRKSSCITSLDNNLWIFGGSSDTSSDQMIRYDVTKNYVTIIEVSSEKKPLPRELAVLFNIQHQIYLYGGTENEEFGDMWVFDQYGFSWSELTLENKYLNSGHSAAVVWDDEVKRERLIVFTNQKDSLISFLTDPTPTSFIIDCKAETKISFLGKPTDNWSDEKIRDIYWCDGYYDCSNAYDEPFSSCGISQAYLTFGIINFISVMIFIGFGVWMIVQRNSAVVKSAAPIFLGLMLVGGSIILSSIFFGVSKPVDAICGFIPWYFIFGFHLMYGSLLVKNWRIAYIFNNTKFQRISYSNEKLALKLLTWSIPDIILLSLNAIVDPPKAHLVSEPDGNNDENKEHYECDFESPFMIILVVYQYCLLFYGVSLAYKTRKLSARFNESKYIALSIYTFGIVSIFTIPIVIFLIEPVSRIIVLAMAILVVVNTTIGLSFFPKIILEKEEPPPVMKSISGTCAQGQQDSVTSNFEDQLSRCEELADQMVSVNKETMKDFLKEMLNTYPGFVDRAFLWFERESEETEMRD